MLASQVAVSMTINAPAAIMMAFYIVAAEEKGIPARTVSAGTVQADILKEYIAQKEWCFPVDPAMRLLGDMVAVVHGHMPRWHPVSDLGLPHPRGGLDGRAGAGVHAQGRPRLRSRSQVDARDGRGRLRAALSFFFNAHIDFFEEIAKYRAARRIWARELREPFGAQEPEVVADALPHADRRASR